jgi:DNA-binding LacI/PurR family transcriptional regulator
VAARRARVTIPGELALACFDDLYFSPLLQPSLTAIAYDTRAIGRKGAQLLLRAIEDQLAPWSEARIDVRLVCRRSCRCAHDPAADVAEVLA